MESKANIQALCERNKKIAESHKPLSLISEDRALGLRPSVLIVTCMDPRCVPEKFLGLQPPESIVIRNVCGHVTPNLNDILAIDHIFQFPELMVIHHTDCGALLFNEAQIRETIKARQPTNDSIDSMTFGAISDLEQSVRDDLAVLRESPLVRKELAENAAGFVFDVKTGILSRVAE
ncbi:hypothetical protein G7Y79_00005g017720 [Physcia stellaris]|nr:hypothetical protein G7Y79_00005g017720 [Physcia stellaris]